MPDRQLYFRMFGGLEVTLSGVPLPRLRTRRAQSLLAYLALHPGPVHRREAIAELIWPDGDDDAARASLRNELAALRRVLEPDESMRGSLLVVQGSRLGLAEAAVETDVARFRALVDASLADSGAQLAGLQEALGLYAGDLLPELYDDWIGIERDSLFERFVAALISLSQLHLVAGESQAARDAARRAVTADFFNGAAHSALIRACLASGRPDAALEDYDAYAAALQHELNDQPEPEITALVEAIDQRGHIRLMRRRASGYRASGGGLPRASTSYFGREAETRTIVDWLVSDYADEGSDRIAPRLLTIVGPGGCGKTRLALEAARLAVRQFGLDVQLVSLADARTYERLLGSVAVTLGLGGGPSATPLEQRIAAACSGRFAALLLDNLEQAAEPAASMVSEFLRAAPDLRLLATSRSRLGVDGERVLQLAPLDVPAVDAPVEKLLSYPCVRLFADRAAMAGARLDIDACVRDIAALCASLEGIPLAIELAAGRASVMTPTQMQRQLARRLDLLVSRRRGGPARHGSMSAAIEWSYDLLSDASRRALGTLSVLRGAWSLEAAAAVLSVEPIEALEAMERLVHVSLLQTRTDGATTRYLMLETVREFADARLTGEEANLARLRHAQHFTAMLAAAGYSAIEPWPADTIGSLEADEENLLAVLERFLRPDASANELQLGLRMTVCVYKLLYVQGAYREGLSWCERALRFGHDRMDERVRADLHYGAAVHCDMLADHAAAVIHAEASIAIRRRLEDSAGLAMMLTLYGRYLRYRGDDEAGASAYRESVEIARATGDLSLQARVLANYGGMLHHADQLEAARDAYVESLQLAERAGARRAAVVALLSLSDIEADAGRSAVARAFAERAIREAATLKDVRFEAIGRLALSLAAIDECGLDEARELQSGALREFVAIGDLAYVAGSLLGCAHCAAAEGELYRAVRLLGGADALRAALHIAYSPYEMRRLGEFQRSLSLRIPQARFRSQWSRGRTMTVEALVEEACTELDQPDGQRSRL